MAPGRGQLGNPSARPRKTAGDTHGPGRVPCPQLLLPSLTVLPQSVAQACLRPPLIPPSAAVGSEAAVPVALPILVASLPCSPAGGRTTFCSGLSHVPWLHRPGWCMQPCMGSVQLCMGCAAMHGAMHRMCSCARGVQPCKVCAAKSLPRRGVCSHTRGVPAAQTSCAPLFAAPLQGAGGALARPCSSLRPAQAAGSRHPICKELQQEHPQRGLPCPAPPRRPANSPSPAPFVPGLASTRAPSAHMTAQTERAIHPGLGADKAEAEEKPTRLPGSEAVDSSRPLSPSALRWAPSARGARATPSPVPGAAERARRAPGRRAGREAASSSVEGAGSLPPAQPLPRGVPAGCCGVPRWCSS